MNTLRIWTVILNFLVLVGRGHGVATVGVLGIFGLTQLISGEFNFTITGSYEHRLETAGLISLVGEVLLFGSIWMKDKRKFISTLSACVILFSATLILAHDAEFMNFQMISLFCSIPYLVTTILILRKEIQNLSSA